MTRTAQAMECETDAERMRHSPGRAFDWAMREVSMPSESAQAELREAFLAVVHDDHTKAVRTLERAWPEGARWLSGEAYLRTLGWRAPDDFGGDDEAHDAWADGYDGPELMELLYQRLLHATHRIYRDVQVRRVLDPASPQRIRTYTHALLNRDGDFRGDPCGLGVDKIISIEEALALMQQPAHHHPVCRCTVDPFPITSTDRAKLQTALLSMTNNQQKVGMQR